MLQDKYLIYDDVTSSYALNLPVDYYQRYLQSSLPAKEDGRGQWFVRPHHVECLTTHVESVKDDVINTWYVSHYKDPSNVKKVSDIEAAISGLEEHLDETK